MLTTVVAEAYFLGNGPATFNPAPVFGAFQNRFEIAIEETRGGGSRIRAGHAERSRGDVSGAHSVHRLQTT